MIDVLIMGEILVEIMREKQGVRLHEAGTFLGPFPSGAPAICIDAAARLGCKTALIGGVGKDDFGKNVLDRLCKDGVDCSRVLESETRATGCAFVTYFEDGSRQFIFHMGNTPAVEAKAPLEMDEEVKYMHIMGCSLMSNKEFAQEILKLMRMLQKKGTKISFDPNIRKELYTDPSISQVIDEVFKATHIFLPGVEELLTITKQNTIEDAIKTCFENENMELIVLKKGAKGSVLYTRDSQPIEVGVYKVEEKDATGAGDCFDGAFLAGLAQGKELLYAAKMGAAAGAINAGTFGPMEGDIRFETVTKRIEGK